MTMIFDFDLFIVHLQSRKDTLTFYEMTLVPFLSASERDAGKLFLLSI